MEVTPVGMIHMKNGRKQLFVVEPTAVPEVGDTITMEGKSWEVLKVQQRSHFPEQAPFGPITGDNLYTYNVREVQ